MKKSLIILLAFAFAPAFAEDVPSQEQKPQPPHAKRGEHKGGGAMRERMKKRFDKDGDGQLSESEKAEAKAFMEKRKAEMEAKKKEFDKDGDGKLSDEEKAAFRKAHKAAAKQKQ